MKEERNKVVLQQEDEAGAVSTEEIAQLEFEEQELSEELGQIDIRFNMSKHWKFRRERDYELIAPRANEARY